MCCCSSIRIGPDLCYREQISDRLKMELPKVAKVLLIVLGLLAILAAIAACAGVPGVGTIGLSGEISLIAGGIVLFLLGTIPIKIHLKVSAKQRLEQFEELAAAKWIKSNLMHNHPILTDFLTNPLSKYESITGLDLPIVVDINPLQEKDGEFVKSLLEAYPEGIRQIKEQSSDEGDRQRIFNTIAQFLIDRDGLLKLLEMGWNQNQPEKVKVIKLCILYIFDRDRPIKSSSWDASKA